MSDASSFRIAFDPAWPPVALLLVAVALVAVVWFTYRPRIMHLQPLRRRLLIAFRMAGIALLLFAVLRPEVRFTEMDENDAVLLVLSDASRSMLVSDAPGGISRRAALVRSLTEQSPKLKELQETFEFQYMDFADSVKAIEGGVEGLSGEAAGDQTAIGAVLNDILKANSPGGIAAVLLLTEGAQRALPPRDANPREVARQFGEAKVPIYPIIFGSEGAQSSFDLAVEELVVDPSVFEKKVVPVKAKVRIAGGSGRSFAVRILLEDRTGLRPGESGELKPIAASENSRPIQQVSTDSNNAVVPVDLSFVPQQPGEFKIAVEIIPADSESKLTNNRRQTIINVQKGGLKVALFAAPLAEQKWIRNVNTEQKIQLDLFDVRTGRLANQSVIDASWFESGKYDAYIIADVPASAFGSENLDLLADRISDGAGLMMLGGPRSFGPGGWASTPVAPFLPVQMQSSAIEPSRALDAAHHIDEPQQMLPTRPGLLHYVMQLGATENLAVWRSLPPLAGANRISPRNGGLAEVLAESADGTPLLIADTIGAARVMAFAGDTTYLWYMSGHEVEHQRFWRQIVLWLTGKEFDSDQPVWIIAQPRNRAPGETVSLEYGARDEKGTPVLDADFKLEISSADGTALQRNAAGGSERNTFRFNETTVPGDYWVRVIANRAGKSLGLDGWTRFIVEDRDLELENPAADPALLNEIAELSGGTVIPPEQLGDLLDRWLDKPPGRERLEVSRRIPLWDNGFLIAIFVAIIGSEWFLRKRSGLV